MKQIYYILMVLLFVGLITGCTKTPTVTTDVNGSIKTNTINELDLVVTSIQFNGVLYPMQNNKVKPPENLKINIKETDYNQGELYTLVSKKPTIGILSNINVGKAYLKGEEYKVLAPYYREILGPNDMTMGQVVSLKTSDIKSPNDLEGKTVGIQGLADGSTISFMTAISKIYQVDLNSIDFQVVDSNMAPILLSEGKLDATMLDSDYILTDEFNSKYNTVIDFNKEIYYWYGTVPPASFFVVKKEFYDKDPLIYDSVISYFTEAYKWYKDNAEEVSLQESIESGSSFDLTLLKSQYEERAGVVTEKDVAAYYDFYDIAKQREVIDSIPDLNDIFIR